MKCSKCGFNNTNNNTICGNCGAILLLKNKVQVKNRITIGKYKQQRIDALNTKTIYDIQQKDNGTKEIKEAYKELNYIVKDYEYNEKNKQKSNNNNLKVTLENKKSDIDDIEIIYEKNYKDKNNNHKDDKIIIDNTKRNKYIAVGSMCTVAIIIICIVIVSAIKFLAKTTEDMLKKSKNEATESELYNDDYINDTLSVYASDVQTLYKDKKLKIYTNTKDLNIGDDIRILYNAENKDKNTVRIGICDVSINWRNLGSDVNLTDENSIQGESEGNGEIIIDCGSARINNMNSIEFRFKLDDEQTNKVEITGLHTNRPKIKAARAIER